MAFHSVEMKSDIWSKASKVLSTNRIMQGGTVTGKPRTNLHRQGIFLLLKKNKKKKLLQNLNLTIKIQHFSMFRTKGMWHFMGY